MTVDEVKLTKSKLVLIEGKHSKSSILPSISDIKNGLLKMILYSNLCDVFVEDKNLQYKAVLSLTSSILQGEINNKSKLSDVYHFFDCNAFSSLQREMVNTIFKEAEHNNFTIKIGYSL